MSLNFNTNNEQRDSDKELIRQIHNNKQLKNKVKSLQNILTIQKT